MHCWLSLVVSLDDGSLAELWLRSLSATFVAGRKMTCYSIFSILIATKCLTYQLGEGEEKEMRVTHKKET